MMEELIGYDAVTLGGLIRKGEITPVELLDSTIQRIEKVNPQLNAVIHKIYDQARELAESWSAKLVREQAEDVLFCGVPFLGPLFGDLGGGIVCEHALTRTVRDSAALLDGTSGPDIGDPYYAPPKDRPFLEEVKRNTGRLKIGFLLSVPEGWSYETRLHPDCVKAVKDAARLCEDLGHIVEEIDPEQSSDPRILHNYNNIWSCLIGHIVAYWERELGRKIGQDELEPLNWEDYQAGLKISGGEYLVTLEEVQRFSRKIARWYHAGGYDLLLNPTMRIPPSKYGTFQSTKEDPGKLIDVARSCSALTRIQNLTGQPAMSVPLFWTEGNVPIGVQFAAPFGDEATLFRLAAQLEQARPWNDRKPAVHCSHPS